MNTTTDSTPTVPAMVTAEEQMAWRSRFAQNLAGWYLARKEERLT